MTMESGLYAAPCKGAIVMSLPQVAEPIASRVAAFENVRATRRSTSRDVFYT